MIPAWWGQTVHLGLHTLSEIPCLVFASFCIRCLDPSPAEAPVFALVEHDENGESNTSKVHRLSKPMLLGRMVEVCGE